MSAAPGVGTVLLRKHGLPQSGQRRPRVQIIPLKAWLISFLPTSFSIARAKNDLKALLSVPDELIGTERTGRHSSGSVTLQLLLQSDREKKKTDEKEKEE